MSEPLKPVARVAFVRRALELVHTPYIYGGRSPNGVDCWGIIALAWDLAGGTPGLFEWWTDVGWNKLEVVDKPEPGDLAFYGGSKPTDVSHVMVTLWGGMLIGASGGDSKVKTVVEAYRRAARVKIVESAATYDGARGDFRGFRRLPFRSDT